MEHSTASVSMPCVSLVSVSAWPESRRRCLCVKSAKPQSSAREEGRHLSDRRNGLLKGLLYLNLNHKDMIGFILLVQYKF